MKSYHCISLVVAEEQKEFVLGICYSFGMLGCEEEDNENGVLLRCYFQDKEIADKTREYIKKTIPLVQIEISKIENQDWNEKWRRSMEPVLITENVWVSPVWLKPNM